MGRWVTSKGRRIYIPDEGEENPFVKDSSMSHKEQAKANAKAIKISKHMPKEKWEELKAEKKKWEKLAKDASNEHYDERLNDIADRMKSGKITPDQAKDEAFEYEKSQRKNKKWSDVDRNRMESKVQDIFDAADKRATISKNNDTKEKQIAGSKKQADKLNGKTSKMDLSTKGTYKLSGQKAPKDLPKVSAKEAKANKVVKYNGTEYQTQPVSKDLDGKDIHGVLYVPRNSLDKGSFFVAKDGTMWHDGSQYLNNKQRKKK